MSKVMMVCPTPVKIYDKNHVLQTFGPGMVEVPEELADHSYFERHGAKKYDAKAEAARLQKEAEAKELEAKITEAEAELAEAEESGDNKKITAAKKKLEALTPKAD